ncbi:MAG: hypothetical protein ACPLRM_06905, partial [Anaerolineae bacterium]
LKERKRKMAGGGSSELRAMAERIAKLEAELEALQRRLTALERSKAAEASKSKERRHRVESHGDGQQKTPGGEQR